MKYNAIDGIKGIAILSVIFLHTVATDTLVKIGASFYVWLAMPIFMIINGMNNAGSFKRRGLHSFREVYDYKILSQRLTKIFIPYLFFGVIECVAMYLAKKTTIAECLKMLLVGGAGPGGYFIPIMIQSTFLLPCIYWLGSRKSYLMLGLTFFCSLMLELMTVVLHISDGIYRLLIIRYIFAIGVGVWVVCKPDKKVNTYIIAIGAIIGALYIFAINYAGFNQYVQWGSQHAPAYFYAYALILLLTAVLNKIGKYRLLATLGKASYHIFLVQMLFFLVADSIKQFEQLNVFIRLSINIITTCVAGFAFFIFDKRISSKTQI